MQEKAKKKNCLLELSRKTQKGNVKATKTLRYTEIKAPISRRLWNQKRRQACKKWNH